ncbi:MAG TPA: cation-translocating P-type ATPase C-terminal domain-containing protein, partial [Anaerolineae bacterium]|nr:cation-translocating P-type ATPase C-terminal domain-containing protein [Anaerolineae bacterium]
IGTLAVETHYEPVNAQLAATMGFAVFSLFNIVIGLSSRSETETLFQVQNFTDRQQLMLYGLSIAITFFSTELGFTQRILKLTPLDGNHWLQAIGLALALTLVYEVIKVFLRRSRGAAAAQPGSSSTLASSAGS